MPFLAYEKRGVTKILQNNDMACLVRGKTKFTNIQWTK
jgi:hypothetical protein